jgi:RNA polymerase sigma factor (sigma-70 family)
VSDLPSAELLARCRARDAAAEEELFARYVGRLLRLARNRLSSRLAARVDAEDVVQSAYRSFFRLAAQGDLVVRESGELWRLLARITVRKVCRAARRHRAGCRSVEREAPGPGEDDTPERAVLSREPSPAEAAALCDELRAVLDPMGPVQRRIVALRLQGLDVDEIAAAVGRSGRTVRRVLAALGEELERRLRADSGPPVDEGGIAFAFGDIVLERQLGAGGMGKVYRARLRQGGAAVAVKILRKSLRGHEPAAAHFLREAGILARLHHPGIVVVHGLGRLPHGGHFLVMDLVEGGDLMRRRAAGPVELASALDWVRQAADAVEHAHRQGVVHCDLKPSNLLLDGRGRVRVSDFGLARSLDDRDGCPSGGTPGFLAPEQADPARGPVTPRTDVHGLGAVLYALLQGRPPFEASGAETAPDMAGLPAPVSEFCGRCLAAEPADRFASAADAAQALAAILRALA